MNIYFESYSKNTPSVAENLSSYYETSWNINKNIGTGSVKRITFRKGFELYINNFSIKEPITLSLDHNQSAFGLSFRISCHTKIISAPMESMKFKKNEKSPLFYYPDHSMKMQEPSGSVRLGVAMVIDPDVFYDMTNEVADSVPKEFRKFSEGSMAGIYGTDNEITPAMSDILSQIINCSFTGSARKIFFESKSLELLSHKLDQINRGADYTPKPEKLCRSEIEKIHYAASKLCFDLENPPSLFELATSAGISHTKLNRGFRETFGTTAFGYLRQERLKHAKMLLETGELNVTESAFAVGYSSLSSFTRAFRETYGCNPHTCLCKCCLSRK